MCPSTSCGTCLGSQLGIWLATAVISPKLNDARPSRKRMRTSVRRRSLRIRRRRKRRILASGAVLDAQERLGRRNVRAAVLFHGHEDRRAAWNGPFEQEEA